MIKQITEENKEPVLKLAGSNLSKNGFNVGDIVRVSFSENQISVHKNTETEKLQRMQEKNPSIKLLCEKFNLELL